MPSAAEIAEAIEATEWVSKNVRMYRNRFMDREDMLQSGLLAVARSVQAYNEDAGVPFVSFACMCAQREMHDYVRRGIRNHRGMREYLEYSRRDNVSMPRVFSEQDAVRVWDEADSMLSDQHVSILKDRFVNGRTMNEIAVVHGVSRQRIDQKINASLKILRNSLVLSELAD